MENRVNQFTNNRGTTIQTIRERKQERSHIEQEIGWMPPVEIRLFVEDTLEHTFDIRVEKLNRYWIPVGVKATIDWIRLSGWWPFIYSSIFHSAEEYETIFRFNGSMSWEMDPRKIKVFRNDAIRNAFEKRRNHPGLSWIEKGEVIGFIREVICPKLDIPAPSVFVTERIAWATLMWVISQEGEDWLYEQDPIISSAMDFGVSFLHSFYDESLPDFGSIEKCCPFNVMEYTQSNHIGGDLGDAIKVLRESLYRLEYKVDITDPRVTQDLVDALISFQKDESIKQSPFIDMDLVDAIRQAIASQDLISPEKMQDTKRPVGSCSNCGSSLWCVLSYNISGPTDNVAYLCSACSLHLDDHIDLSHTNPYEQYDKKCESCSNTKCPHIKTFDDGFGGHIPKLWVDTSKKRLEAYTTYLASQPKGTIDGMTADDIRENMYGRTLTDNNDT